MPERCEHFAGLGPVEPRTKGCEDSKHAHALQHFKSTRHPIIVPLEHSETWAWCYVDRRYFDYARATPPGKRSALATLLGRLIGR